MKHRITAVLFLAVFLCLMPLTACGTEPTLADYKAIEAGTPRSEILEKFGEPHSFLSGLFGDIYRCEDKLVIIYYDSDAYGSESAPVLEVHITDRQLPAGP